MTKKPSIKSRDVSNTEVRRCLSSFALDEVVTSTSFFYSHFLNFPTPTQSSPSFTIDLLQSCGYVTFILSTVIFFIYLLWTFLPDYIVEHM